MHLVIFLVVFFFLKKLVSYSIACLNEGSHTIILVHSIIQLKEPHSGGQSKWVLLA